ncbi:MAG: hypothetical protein ACOWWO_18655 [Peptococcaceae bacterium]
MARTLNEIGRKGRAVLARINKDYFCGVRILEDNSQKTELFIMFNCGSVFVTETLEQIEFFISMLDVQDESSQKNSMA